MMGARAMGLVALRFHSSVPESWSQGEALVAAQRRLGERLRETQELVGRLPAAILRSGFSGDSPNN